MAYLMNSLLEPMYTDADVYDRYSLLNPYTQPYADAGMQVPQVQAAPTAPQVSQPLFYNPNSIPGDNYVETYQSPNDPSLAWNDQMRQTAALIERLAAGEQIEGWRYDPGGSWYIPGDSELTGSNPAGAWYNGNFYFAGSGAQQQNDSLSDILKDVAKLAAIMGTAYLGGTALAGAGGGTAAGTAAAAAPVTDAATAAFLEANMGALAPTVSGGFAPAAVASTLAPTAGLLAPEAAQVITITAPKAVAAATPSLLAPAAVTVAAAPIINSLTSTPETFRPSQNYGDGMTGNQTSVYDSVVNTTGSKTAADLAANAVAPVSSAFDWLKANPTAGRLLFSGLSGLLSASGGSSGGSGGYRDSGYRPTVSRGGWQPSVTQRSMPTTPLSLNLPTTGQPNSGLWRYGLLGG